MSPGPTHHLYPSKDGGKPELKPAPHARQIKPVHHVAQFVVNPDKPFGTANKWKMMEVVDGKAPMFDTIYIPKFLRRNGARAAFPIRMTIQMTVEYASVDPGPNLSGAITLPESPA